MKRCLVAGGSGALGGAIALEAAGRGARVGVHWHSRGTRAATLVRTIEARGGTAVALQADLAARAGAPLLLAEFEERAGGPPDWFVSALGAVDDAALLRTAEDAFDRIVRLNAGAVAWVLQAACRRMVESGGGHAVLLGSYAGMVGRVGGAAYVAAKAALVGLARSVARELGPAGVRVNVVIPPFVEEGMGAAASPDFVEDARARSLLGRTGGAAECARFVCDLLAREDVSGQVLAADSRLW